MAHEGGAFKVNCGIGGVLLPLTLRKHFGPGIPKFRCRKFSHFVRFAQKINSLPLRHTFLSPKH
jgi:hypothetical protein